MSDELKNLFLNHQGKISDKWTLYINEWDKIFSPFKNREINLLEIGIQNGGSLEVWSKYFPKAKNIIGCDIEESCKELAFDDPRISIVIGDANTADIENKISKISSDLDIVIDDGSHKSSDIIRSFARYYKKINNNGVYIFEDLHTSYWNEFEGGIFNPYSAMAFLKRLTDVLNFEHWRDGKKRVNYLSEYVQKFKLNLEDYDLCRIHSMNFLNSLCVVQMSAPEDNLLGSRVVVGVDENITKDWKKLHGTSIHDITTKILEGSYQGVFSLLHQTEQLEVELEKIHKKNNEIEAQLAERDKTIQDLNLKIEQKDQEIIYYALSKSWRYTRPFREIMKRIRGNRDA